MRRHLQADVVRIALDKAEGFPFERFANAFYEPLIGTSFVSLGAIRDGGADAREVRIYEGGGKHFEPPGIRTASDDDATFIYREWDARTPTRTRTRTRAHDIDGLLALYPPGATLDWPLVGRSWIGAAVCSSAVSRSGRSCNAASTSAPPSSCAGTATGATTSTARP